MKPRPRKTLLVAGGGYADIPMIEAAKRLGFYVITSGNRPDELGHQHSHEYCAADFSDKDAILDIAQRMSVDAICPSCNDFSAISSAWASEQLGLPGHDPFETSLLIHHKDRYRDFAISNAIPTPVARSYSDMRNAVASRHTFRFPVIVKPVDLTGGKGITRVDAPEDFDRAIENAFSISRSSRIVVEEFLEGSRHGFSAFLRGGKVVFHFSDDEYYYLNPYLVSAASTPTSVPGTVIDELVTQSEKIAGLLKLCDGIFHVQFIMNRGQPVIIEICRRPPGDLYVELVRHATGVDYPSWIVKGFTGEPCTKLTQREPTGNFLRHCIMADREGITESVAFDPSVENLIIDRMMFWQPGDPVENHLVHKFGIVFAQFATHDELVRKSMRMQELVKASVA